MTTMPRRSGVTDTTRSAQKSAQTSDNSQAMAKATESFVAATAECQREMLSFMSMRLEKDGEAVKEMAECKNMADALALHSRWMEETLQDYNAQVTRLMWIFSSSVNSGGRVER